MKHNKRKVIKEKIGTFSLKKFYTSLNDNNYFYTVYNDIGNRNLNDAAW